MDTGAVAGKSEAIRRDEAVFEGEEDGGETEELLEPFLIMEGEGILFLDVSGQGVRLVMPSITMRVKERMI